MSAYIITGEARSVSKMYIGVDGKARQVKKAYIGIDGAAKLWYQRSTPLGTLAVGSTVKIAVGGTDYDWLVVHQGLPGSMYDASCNGVWLLMLGSYTSKSFDSAYNRYAESRIHSYLNGTFYNLIDAAIRSAINTVKIPYTYYTSDGASSGYVHSGSKGLSTKVFILSVSELDCSASDANVEGTRLAYFQQNGVSSWSGCWTRSSYYSRTDYIYSVTSRGVTETWYGSNYGVSPCMILPQEVLVDDTGHIIGTDDPRTPLGWHSVGSTIKMDINGNKRVWRIAYKGNPNPNLYDESCNGVWLVLNTIYSTRANGNDCQYAGGIIDTYLNGTFLGRIDKDGNAAKYIKEVKIPYAKKQEDGSWQVQTKENGLPCKVFLPSILELGGAENLSIYKDGSKLGYYDGSAATLTLKQSGTPAPWRTRTVTSDAQSEFSVDANGTITTCAPTDVIGVVPCVIMNPDALVENGIIIGE
nr:MAG TPA: hypothetical protein [Caudoviricetes sp.]